jgi:hypothetical protein
MERSNQPARKVGAGALAAALVTVGTFVADKFNYKVDPELASGVTTLLSFAVGYFTKDPRFDAGVSEDSDHTE